MWYCECMECLGMLVWIRMGGCCRETVTRNWCSRPSEPVSPKRELQKQARFTLELSLRQKALIWARWRLAQARGARLSENAWGPWHVAAVLAQVRNLTFGRGVASLTVGLSENAWGHWHVVAVSPKRGPVAWAKEPFRLSEGSWLERDWRKCLFSVCSFSCLWLVIYCMILLPC